MVSGKTGVPDHGKREIVALAGCRTLANGIQAKGHIMGMILEVGFTLPWVFVLLGIVKMFWKGDVTC